MKDDIQKLRRYVDLLDLYEERLRESVENARRTQESHAIMLRAFAFGCATLKAMVAVANGGDDECGACMPTLCRPFYEQAVRVLWASDAPNRWERLQKHYANEDSKWATRAVQIPSWAERARSVLNNAKSVLSRTDGDDNSYSQLPNMAQTLQEVERDSIDRGIKTEKEGFAQFEYAMLWQRMCGTVHAHFRQIALPPEEHTLVAVNGAAVATFALLRAMAVEMSDANGFKEEVEVMGQQIIEILKPHRSTSSQ